MSDNLIMKTHYRTLRAIYDTKTQLYEELLDLGGKKKTHTQNLGILISEVYKSLNNISLPFIWDYFKKKKKKQPRCLKKNTNTWINQVQNKKLWVKYGTI